MYKCSDCGNEFEEFSLQESLVGDYCGSPCYEDVKTCPFCGSTDYEEMQKCQLCGECFDKLIGGACKDCWFEIEEEFDSISKCMSLAGKDEKATVTIELNPFLAYAYNEAEIAKMVEESDKAKADHLGMFYDFLHNDESWTVDAVKRLRGEKDVL